MLCCYKCLVEAFYVYFINTHTTHTQNSRLGNYNFFSLYPFLDLIYSCDVLRIKINGNHNKFVFPPFFLLF